MINIIVSDIKKALEKECYFSALALALTLPDICGKASYNYLGVGERYKKWCKEFVCEMEKPISPIGDDMPYMSEEVLYSLRNSFLHQGTPNIDINKITQERCKIDKFELILTDANAINSGTAKISYGANMRIVEREQSISIRYICMALCNATEKFYAENKEKFDFFNYSIIDERSKYF